MNVQGRLDKGDILPDYTKVTWLINNYSTINDKQ